jgi:hypothetical protein
VPALPGEIKALGIRFFVAAAHESFLTLDGSAIACLLSGSIELLQFNLEDEE